MERRRSAGRRKPPSGVAGSAAPLPQRAGITVDPLPMILANIQAIIDGGGQILIGTVKPIIGAAVAHDGTKTLAMLRRRPQEPIATLLTRLDSAIATATRTGLRVDEINKPSADTTYEF